MKVGIKIFKDPLDVFNPEIAPTMSDKLLGLLKMSFSNIRHPIQGGIKKMIEFYDEIEKRQENNE